MDKELQPLKGPQAPWMKEPEGDNMLLVHMNEDELEGLDNMQGGPSIMRMKDGEEVREYKALEPMIENQEIRNMFLILFKDLESGGEKAQKVEKVYGELKGNFSGYEPTQDEESGGPLEQAEEEGEMGDTKLAYIPQNLAALLIEIKGGKPDINPQTGLMQFGWLKKIFTNPGSVFKSAVRTVTKRPLKVVGTVLGGMLAGPLGAGIGNYAGGRLHGESHGRAFQSASPFAALYGAQGLGQAAGLLGGSPNMLAQGLGNLGMGGAGAVPQAGIASMGNIAGSPIGNLMQTGASSYGMAPAAGMAGAAQNSGGLGALLGGGQGGSGLGSMLNFAAPFATYGLTQLGAKKDAQNARKQREEEMREMEVERARRGMTGRLREAKPPRKVKNPAYRASLDEAQRDLERKHDIFREPEYLDAAPEYFAKGGAVKSYKKGALVIGKGKGQDDTVRTSVPDGSYIIDASSTSMFGDGSTKAGNDVLASFEKEIRSKHPAHVIKRIEREIGRGIKQVPVFLSEGERKIDPVTVALLGGGSNHKGASMLKEMVIKLRKHKISKGDGLPPKAKHPISYI